MTHTGRALIVVDVQNDFSSTGALPIKGGEEVVRTINALMPHFDRVILTQDWHPEGHCSLKQWARHCVQGSYGARFIDGLATDRAHAIIRKGMMPDVDSYSAFIDNDQRSVTGLAGLLMATGCNDVFVCGLALDYCVAWTALDAVRGGRSATVIIDACRGILPETVKDASTKMAGAGVRLRLSTEVMP